MRRRLAAALLIALSLPALALAASTDPQKRFTAADKAKAASLVLKQADFVAGWKKAAASPSSDGDYSCPGYNPDQSDLVLTGESEAAFTAPEGIPSVYSVANVYKTRREAMLAWGRNDKPALVPCLAKAVQDELAKSGTKITVTRKGRIAFTRYAPRQLVLRLGLTATVSNGGKSTSLPLTVHMLVFGHGRGDVVLMAIGLGGGVPVADLRAFAKLTATRLAAAKL